MIVGHPAAVDIYANEPETCPGLPVMLGLTVVSASRLPSTALGPNSVTIGGDETVIIGTDTEERLSAEIDTCVWRTYRAA